MRSGGYDVPRLPKGAKRVGGQNARQPETATTRRGQETRLRAHERGVLDSTNAPAPDRSLAPLIERVLPIARKRAELAAQMKDALEKGDEKAALQLLRKYLGLPIVEVS